MITTSRTVEAVVNGAVATPTLAPRRLYRHVPVPPFSVDDDGYLAEDSMGHNSEHMVLFAYFHALKRRLKGVAEVHCDLFMFYREGDRGAVLAPDLLVAFGAENKERFESYKLWEEPTPGFVLEVLSKETWKKDTGIKKDTYEHIGVRECWLFDSRGKWLDAPLVGYRLANGVYERIEPNPQGRLESVELGLELHVTDGELRIYDPKAGADLRTLDEAEQGLAAATTAAADATRRADEAEARAREAEKALAELRSRLGA